MTPALVEVVKNINTATERKAKSESQNLKIKMRPSQKDGLFLLLDGNGIFLVDSFFRIRFRLGMALLHSKNDAA